MPHVSGILQQAPDTFPNIRFLPILSLRPKLTISHTVQVTILNQVKTRSTASNEDWTNALHRHPQINSTKSHMALTTIGK